MIIGRKVVRSACISALAVALVFLFAPSSIRATSIFVPEDQSLFEFVILPAGPITIEGETFEARDLLESELEGLGAGAQYWANMLSGAAQNNVSLRIMVFGDTEENASAYSPVDTSTGLTALARGLIKGTITQTSLENYLAFVEIGSGLTYSQDNRLWALPRNGQDVALSSVIVHELMHALGLLFDIDENTASDFNDYKGAFPENLQLFVDHVYDAFGTRAAAGMSIQFVSQTGYENLKTNPDERAPNTFYLVYPDSFDSSYGFYKGMRTGAYFSGEHVLEVLNGAELSFPEDEISVGMGISISFPDKVPGLPLNGLEPTQNGYTLSQMVHVELQNSLISHQNWRNWGILMEAEIALLQDLGYEIDRRQHFGYSIYNDDLSDFVNNNPYYKRENGQWVVGEPNETAWGIGLHVYGSSNTITQAADILTVGYDATGIRLEGVGNVLTVAEGVSVKSDGQYGTGLLVSYGKGHEVNVEGAVTALGDGGVAARFDFGDNLLGNNNEYRGSYMWSVGGETPENMLSKINGELVTAFNVSGTLMGADKAIYIAENAYVETINLSSRDNFLTTL